MEPESRRREAAEDNGQTVLYSIAVLHSRAEKDYTGRRLDRYLRRKYNKTAMAGLVQNVILFYLSDMPELIDHLGHFVVLGVDGRRPLEFRVVHLRA